MFHERDILSFADNPFVVGFLCTFQTKVSKIIICTYLTSIWNILYRTNLKSHMQCVKQVFRSYTLIELLLYLQNVYIIHMSTCLYSCA